MDSTDLGKLLQAQEKKDRKKLKEEESGRRLAILFSNAVKKLSVITEDYEEADVYKMWDGFWRVSLDAEDCIDCFHQVADSSPLLRTLWAVAPPKKKHPYLKDFIFSFSKTHAWKKFIETLPLEHYASVVFRMAGPAMDNPWILTNISNGTQVRGYTRIVVPASGQVPDVTIMPMSKYIEEQKHG